MSRYSAYHSLVAAFQVEVIRRALAATGGNRTQAARLLGLQRTYLLRLMRDRGIDVPRSVRNGRNGHFAATSPEFRIEITGWEPLAPRNGDDRDTATVSVVPSSRPTERDRSTLIDSLSASRGLMSSASPRSRARS